MESILYTFQVDGLPFDDESMANVVADRIYKRYGAKRTIVLYSVDCNGDKTPIRTLDAKKPSKPECPDTIDMFQSIGYS